MNQSGLKAVKKYAPALLPNVGFAPPPRRKQRVVTVYTDWLAMSPQSQHKELAWELMTFLLEPDNLAAYDSTMFFIPPRRSVAKSAKFMRENPQLQDFANLMDKYGRSLPGHPRVVRDSHRPAIRGLRRGL